VIRAELVQAPAHALRLTSTPHQERLVALHPYELPELIAVPVTEGHRPYLDWVRDPG